MGYLPFVIGMCYKMVSNKQFYIDFEDHFLLHEEISRQNLEKWIMKERGITRQNLIKDWVKKLEVLEYIRYEGGNWYINLKF